jgi:hypothetical protein
MLLILINITRENDPHLWLYADDTRIQIHDRLCDYLMICSTYLHKFQILNGNKEMRIIKGFICYNLYLDYKPSWFIFSAEYNIFYPLCAKKDSLPIILFSSAL